MLLFGSFLLKENTFWFKMLQRESKEAGREKPGSPGNPQSDLSGLQSGSPTHLLADKIPFLFYNLTIEKTTRSLSLLLPRYITVDVHPHSWHYFHSALIYLVSTVKVKYRKKVSKMFLLTFQMFCLEAQEAKGNVGVFMSSHEHINNPRASWGSAVGHIVGFQNQHGKKFGHTFQFKSFFCLLFYMQINTEYIKMRQNILWW